MGDYIANLSFLADPLYWAVVVAAVLMVGAFGVIPGVGGPTIMAIALPILLFSDVDRVVGITFLAAMAGLGNTLDSIPAVLLGYPGAATQVTFLEGHQLAMRGEGARTLGAVYSVSALGGVVGALSLLAVLPVLRPIMLRFSFPEIAVMALFGVLMVAILSRGAMLKGLIAAALGLFLGTIGTSSIAGEARFSLGWLYLFDGLPLIPLTLGIFALPELIDLTMRGRPVSPPGSVSTREVLSGALYGIRRWRMVIRQSVFGVFLGAIPGIGSAVIDWLSYAFGMAFTKDKSNFGKGDLDGVLFAESAQNSKEAGQAIPSIAFGIPGGLSWAIILVAMTAFGVAPGPGMLDANQNLDVTMALVVTLALGNLMITMLGMVATGQLAKLTLIPYPLLAVALIPLMFSAAYQTNNSWGDILVVLATGVLGLAMKWWGWPRPPLILGFVLGPIIEDNLWKSVQAYGLEMVTRPLFIVLLVFVVGTTTALFLAMRKTAVEEELPQTEEPVQLDLQTVSSPLAQLEGGVGTSTPNVTQRRPAWLPTLRLHWRWETAFPVLLLGVSVWAFVETQGFITAASRFLPNWVSLALIILFVIYLVLTLTQQQKKFGIMDIGMRSGTDRTAVLRLLVVIGWLGMFFAAVLVVGIPLGSVLFAAVFGPLNVRFRGLNQLWSLAPAVLLAVVMFGFFGPVFYVEWPRSLVFENF